VTQTLLVLKHLVASMAKLCDPGIQLPSSAGQGTRPSSHGGFPSSPAIYKRDIKEASESLCSLTPPLLSLLLCYFVLI
jgi:hypothetical protein